MKGTFVASQPRRKLPARSCVATRLYCTTRRCGGLAAAAATNGAAAVATIDEAEKARKEAELSPLRLGSKTSLRQIALPTTSSHAPCELQSTPPPYHLQSNLCAGDRGGGKRLGSEFTLF